MRLRLLTFTVVLVQWPAAIALADFELKNDDRVVFFGDSLVYADGFIKFVETFVRVKYPALSTRFIDAGLRRQTAGDGLQRVEEDMATLSPTVVVVLFGFDDPDRRALDEGKLAEFRKDYAGIVERIKKLGCRIILITPACPAARQLPQVPDVDYVEVVGRYAQAVREIGAAAQAPVVDWFESSCKLADREQIGADRTRRPELVPPRLAHALLAAELLKLWKAEPIRVEIDVDWGAASAGVTPPQAGRAGAERAGENELTVKLEGIPLPWALPSIKPEDLQAGDWDGADLCQYVLKMKNVPPSGVSLIQGRQSLRLTADQLQHGVNITGWKPLQAENEGLKNLLGYYARKRDSQLKFLREVKPRRPEEPEFLEAWELMGRAFRLYEEGAHQVLMRLPKTFDVLLSFKVPTPPDAPPPTDTQPGPRSTPR